MVSQPKPALKKYIGKISDPSRWNSINPREGDIVTSTPPKSGTTWVQGILALLISGDPKVDANISNVAPWVDIDFPGQDEILKNWTTQTHRRQMKTHTPFDGIPIWSELRYISVYRHPIDVHFSFRNHVKHMKDDVLGECFPADISKGFQYFLDGNHQDGASLSSIVDHYRAALANDKNKNFLRLHYADLSRDLNDGIARIAAHARIAHSSARMAKLVDAATFKNMKTNANRFAVDAGQGFWKNDTDFFESGTSNKWTGQLSDADLAAYDARMSGLLNVEERAWLEWGTKPA